MRRYRENIDDSPVRLRRAGCTGHEAQQEIIDAAETSMDPSHVWRSTRAGPATKKILEKLIRADRRAGRRRRTDDGERNERASVSIP